MDQEKEEIFGLGQKVGHTQVFDFFANFSRVQIARIIEDLHEGGKYKLIPGCKTFEDVCAKFGFSRQTGYRLKDNLKILGPDLMEIMYKAGISTLDQSRLLKGETIEDAEFEVIDSSIGKIRIAGKTYSLPKDLEEVSNALQRIKISLRQQRLANQGLEAEIEKSKEAVKKAHQKIKEGEELVAKLQREMHKPKIQPCSDMSLAIVELGQRVKQICAMEFAPEDEEPRVKGRYVRGINNMIIGPLTAKFNPRKEDLQRFEEAVRGQNEFREEPEYLKVFDEEDEEDEEVPDA